MTAVELLSAYSVLSCQNQHVTVSMSTAVYSAMLLATLSQNTNGKWST